MTVKSINSMRESVKIKLSPSGTKTFVHAPTGSSARVIGTHGYGGGSYVTGVSTPAHERGKGGAHEVMKQVTRYLDDNGKTGSLKAYGTESGVSNARLRKFYAKHGFVVVDGEGNMRREPRG